MWSVHIIMYASITHMCIYAHVHCTWKETVETQTRFTELESSSIDLAKLLHEKGTHVHTLRTCYGHAPLVYFTLEYN